MASVIFAVIYDKDGRTNFTKPLRTGQYSSTNFRKKEKSLRVLVRLGPGVGSKRKFADFVLNSSCLEFFLIFTNPSDLGMSVNNRWDGIVIDMAMAGLENFDGSDTYSDVRWERECVQ